jgi:hypothetical protein
MPSWIHDYALAIDEVSESPTAFNMWAAISVISSVLKRNVFLHYKTFTIYPNQYIVLVAPPGVGKGTAIHPAHAFSKEAKLVNYMSDRVTAPRIIEKLFQGFSSSVSIVNGQVSVGGKDSSATLMSTELPTLITSSEWMLQFLCDAWDRGEFDYDTKNKGSFTVSDMCVGLIGACVPDYIRRLSKDANASVSSGFSARTIFVYAKDKSKSLPWGEGLKNNPKFACLIKDLEARLVKISQVKGEYKLDPIARVAWDKFYDDLDKSICEDDTDVYKNFRTRQHIHVLKVAMSLAAAESDTLIITAQILQSAIKLVESVAEGVDDIFRGVGESDISAALARIQLYIERKITVTYAEVVEDNIRHVNHDDIVKVLKVLELTGFVTSVVQGVATVYQYSGKPATKRRP